MSSSHATNKTAIITNASDFAGPAAVKSLLDSGYRVIASDLVFADSQKRLEFETTHKGVELCDATEPAEVITEAWKRAGQIHTLISNDHYPAIHKPIEETDTQMFQDTLDALVVRPYEHIRQAVIKFKKQQIHGNIVIINSNRMQLPVYGGFIPDAARSAMHAMIISWAKDFARHGIVINAIAPNYYYSEAYYPKAKFIDNKTGSKFVKENVPVGRLGSQEEMGELITFLAGSKSRFMTGAVIDFSGGWPVQKRPEF